jgi:MoaA/NifB/PqqE/SkfB family radical SAM enzyme/2-polyprenyl-3-methyl-5-hydroxy-6-metoxy-1,4-benzoquinol methylase
VANAPLNRRALIRVGHKCNNNCLFCHLEERNSPDLQNDLVRRKILRARQLGYTLVAFSGGEPTLRRELLSWAEAARSLGLGVGLVTNGRMLAYEAYLDALVRAGLSYAHLSLHAGTETLHDTLVRAPAFAQTLRGIRLLAARPVDVSVGCVVTSFNFHALRDVVDVLAPLGRIRLKFALVDPKGAVLEHPDALPTDIAAAAHRVLDAIEYGLGKSELRFAHEGFPLCLLPGHEAIAEGLRAHGFIAMSNAGEHDFYPVEADMRTFPEPCNDCGLRGRCPGIHPGYLQRNGCAALQPVVCPRSNSLTYTPVRTFTWRVGNDCPISLDGATPYHRARNLFVHHADCVTQYETATNDFNDAELDEYVRQLGQVYVDRSAKLAPNDFAHDVQALRRSLACDRCRNNEHCPGLHVISDSSPFQRDDQQLREILAEIRGSVLDVGCGSGRYLDALAPAALSGQVQYLGVDPDALTLARLQQAWPWAAVRCNHIEEVLLAPESYDNVTMVGSVNHIRDLDGVLAQLVTALHPGGTLLMADDVPFGLLRSRAHADECRHGHAGFEHFRAEDSRRVRSRMSKLPLTIVDERHVDRSTSNQWLIRAVRN